MKQFRQLTALILAAVMSLSLVACGSGSSGTTVKNQRPGSNAVLQQHTEKPESGTSDQFIHKAPEPIEPNAPMLTPLSPPLKRTGSPWSRSRISWARMQTMRI